MDSSKGESLSTLIRALDKIPGDFWIRLLYTHPAHWSDDLIAAIREDKPYGEAKRGIEASVATSMGRMAAHTGQEITYEDMLNCPHEMFPGLDKLTQDTPTPFASDANGRYPVPQPGIVKDREYPA